MCPDLFSNGGARESARRTDAAGRGFTSLLLQREAKRRRWWGVKVTIVLLWLFGVVAAYFWAHKPFDAGIVAGLGRSLANVVVWLGVTWLGAALGRRVVGWFCVLSDDLPAARLALSTGVGLGLLSLLLLGLGLVGLLRPVVAWGLVLVLGGLLWRDLGASLADVVASLPFGVGGAAALPFTWEGRASLQATEALRPEHRAATANRSGFHRWVMIYGVASLSLTFLTALAPPTGWDTLVYHLTGPRFFVEAGRLVHPLDLPYLGFPQLGEMQFTLGLLLAGEGVAPLLHFGYGLLALAITVSLARRFFDVRAAWLAAALLLSVPTLFTLMTWAYVDATLLFYATSALYAFLRWRECRAGAGQPSCTQTRLHALPFGVEEGWLLVAGLCCGFCGGVKYTAVVIPVALGLSLIWTSRRDGLRAIVWRLTLMALAAGGVVLPGLLENLLTTGNPVYPFLFPNGLYWDEWRRWWYDRPGTGLATTAPWRLLTAPLEATILGTEGTVLYEATIGPLLLPSVALLVLTWRGLDREKRAVAGHMLLFFALNYLLWLNGLARTAMLLRSRFLFLVFGAVAVLGGVALDRLRMLRRPRLAVDWLARAVVILTLALLLFALLVRFLQANPLPVVLGVESRDDYLARRLGWYYATVETMNRELPPDAVVLFLWEPRTYHCQVECWPDAMLDRFLHTTHLYGYDADTIARTWRAEGFTHVLLYRVGLDYLLEAQFDPITPADLQVLEELQTSYMTLVESFDDVYELYRLEDVP